MRQIVKGKRFIQWSVLLFFCMDIPFVEAQRTDSSGTRINKRDTLDIYRKIQKKAYKHKFTRVVYQTIFVEPAPLDYEKKPLSDKQKKEDPNKQMEGKTIRHISIIVQDPFGYSANDTNRTYINWWQKAGNVAHITTRKRIIANRLLFKSNDKADFLKILESERLLRSAGFVNDSRIYMQPVSGYPDSVDIVVITQDKWTIDPNITAGTDRLNLRLRDRNLLGLGHTFEQNMRFVSNGNIDLYGNYLISNYGKSYISSNIFYSLGNTEKRIGYSVDRPFYSVLTRFAGGSMYAITRGTYFYTDSILHDHDLNYTVSDHWLANGYNLPAGKWYNRPGVRITGALRYYTMRYQNRPSFDIDTMKLNANGTMYLGSAGISFRKYYKDQYIYRFGANEDVPEGLLFQYLYGFYHKEFSGWWKYNGLEISQGKHFKKLGYLSGIFAIGNLHQNGQKSNITFNAGIYYFSNLSLEKKWYIRQFISCRITQGVNKPVSERVTLRSDEMFGFNSNGLRGTGKIIMNFSTVMYAPYNIVGFKFAPVLLIGLGILQTDPARGYQWPVYQAYSAGLLIRNESLLNSSFEITCGMYPNLPGNSGIVFRLNPVTSFTLRVMSFAISKPAMVAFE